MHNRSVPRLNCSVEVLACTAVEARPARIVDLSNRGAKLRLDRPFEVGAAIHLDVAGDYYWCTVVWAEPDRMGVRFRAPMAGGSLHRRLVQRQIVSAGAGRRSIAFGRRQA